MSYGKLAVDWEERININRMRRERIERTREKARKYGLNALLLLRARIITVCYADFFYQLFSRIKLW